MCLASLEFFAVKEDRHGKDREQIRCYSCSWLGCGWLSKEEVQVRMLLSQRPLQSHRPLGKPPVIERFSAHNHSNTAVSKEELRMLQARLKAAGFYVGPIDGIVGPKTRSGLLRLEAACANLKDLLETSVAGEQTAKLDNPDMAVRRAKTSG